MREIFQDLGKKIEQRLDKENLDLAQISFEELEVFTLKVNLSEFETELSSLLINQDLEKQVNLYNNFGQPPITLFNNNHFVIDIYFWLHHDTSIHDHSFEGSFKVLFGSSLHETFNISFEKNYEKDIAKTKISKKSSEYLYQGHIKKITRGQSFTHRLIHLEAPTITLCIRSINDIKHKQWHHFSNGLSIEKKEINESTLKKFYYSEYLFLRNHENAQVFLNQLIQENSSSENMNFYEQLMTQALPFSEVFIEVFHQTLLHTYQKRDWFEDYQSFYKNLEERHLNLESDSPILRLIEHGYNTNLSKEEIRALLSSYKSYKPTLDDLELIESFS